MGLGPVAAIMADLAAVLDLATRETVGWSMRDHTRAMPPRRLVRRQMKWDTMA